jgi:RNA polymerase sigma-70 factor (ECF subfamily)
MPLPDLDLLSRAQAGDAAAMEELLGRHEKQIYRFGLRMCGSEDDARDVLQETLIAAFKHLPEFRGDADLSTWLYQVARSFCSRSRRRHVGEPARKDSLDAPAVRALASPAMPADAAAHARELGETLQGRGGALGRGGRPGRWRRGPGSEEPHPPRPTRVAQGALRGAG